MARRKLKISFLTPIAEDHAGEYALILTRDGWYVCIVDRCSGEGRRRFRLRARALKDALEAYPRTLLTTSPDED